MSVQKSNTAPLTGCDIWQFHDDNAITPQLTRERNPGKSHTLVCSVLSLLMVSTVAPTMVLAGGGNVLPPTAKPRGYSFSDMAKATAYFNTGGRASNTPNTPFQILYVIDSQTSNTFEVSQGSMFYVPMVFTDNSPSRLVGVFPNINIREELLNYFYSPDQLGNNYTQILVDGEVNSLGSDYVVGVPVPLADGGTQYIVSAAFLTPLSNGTHTVEIRVSFTGKAVG